MNMCVRNQTAKSADLLELWLANGRWVNYENISIQIYWKCYHQNTKFQTIKFWYVSLEPPRWGGSNEYPQSMFLSRNKKNNV